MELPLQVGQLGRITSVYHKLLEYVATFEKQKDSRAIFTYTYSIMTKSILDNFLSAGFKNNESMVILTETFAGFYFTALESYDKNKEANGGWKRAFDTISLHRTSVMEDLVISMYVHIIQDLSLAIAKINSGPPENHIYIGDYHKVNDILKKMINTIVKDVSKRYDPYMYWLDLLVKREIKIFTDDGIRMARTMSWYNGNRIMEKELSAEAIESIQKSINDVLDGIEDNHSFLTRMFISLFRKLLNLGRKWGNT